jgi:RNA methyltransferase, TrmH family
MIHKKITSLSNPLVGKAVDARLGRRGAGQNIFLAEGPHLVGMAASSGFPIEEIFYTGSFIETEAGADLLDQLSCTQAPAKAIVEVTEKILARISDTESPQGIVALVSYAPVALGDLLLKGEQLMAACDGIQDPGNLGTIIRVADAAGADAVVVLPGTCDPFSPKVVRATAGSIFNIPVIIAGRSDFTDYLSSRNIKLIVTDIRARKSLYQSDLTGPSAFAFGNEARGVSESLIGKAAESIRIPIRGKAESLNVAAAAAVCLYEAVRQRMI